MFISDDSNGKSVCDFLFVTNCNQVSFLEGHKTVILTIIIYCVVFFSYRCLFTPTSKPVSKQNINHVNINGAETLGLQHVFCR